MISQTHEEGRRADGGEGTRFLGHLMSVILEPGGLTTGRRREERWQREAGNEIEVVGITAHFKS